MASIKKKVSELDLDWVLWGCKDDNAPITTTTDNDASTHSLSVEDERVSLDQHNADDGINIAENNTSTNDNH